MSFPRYESYKESRISWVGAMPRHWQLCRAKFLFKLMKRSPRDEDEIVTAFRDGEVTLRLKRRVDGFTNSLQEIGYQGVRKGDLVIHVMDAFAGAIGVSDSDGKSTPVYSVCEPIGTDVNAFYYGRLLRHMALSGFINSLAKGVRERSTEFRWAEAGNIELPVPPSTEQSAIATFLDRETVKIDALITEQQRLIELLKEKRQAVISHAVTKGLDPSAPMKDSGIEWLGKVPEHWKVVPVKAVSSCNDEVLEEATAEDFEIEYVEISDIDANRGIVGTTRTAFGTAPSRARRKVRFGDILVSTVRTYLRAIAQVGNPPDNMIASTGFAVIRPRSVQSEFLGYLFRAEFLISEVIARSTGISYPAINVPCLC